jgi:hypothetical protein
MGTQITKEGLEAFYDKAITNYRFKVARWATLEESRLLYTLSVNAKPDVILESGTANGWSALWLSLYGSPVYTFDPVSRPKVWDGVWDTSSINYIQANFSTFAEKLPEVVGKKSLFFIDGLHTSGGMKEDCEAVLDCYSPGDTVVFHDLNIKACARGFHRMFTYASEHEMYQTARIMGRLVLK